MSTEHFSTELNIAANTDWKDGIAEFARALTAAMLLVTGRTEQLKALYPNQEAHLVHVRMAYDAARGEYNSLAEYLRTVLLLGKKGTGHQPPDTRNARDKLDTFDRLSHDLIEAASKSAVMHEFAGFIPSLGDVAKLIDSIWGIFKYFLDRGTKQRHDAANILEKNEIPSWSSLEKHEPLAGGPHTG